MKHLISFAIVVAVSATAVEARAQTTPAPMSHDMHTMGVELPATDGPNWLAADVRFMQGMIPHHQGAIDMANVVLQFGEDEEIKKLANDIIAAQTAEIAWMREWLARKGQP